MLIQSPFVPTSDDVNVIVDRFLPRSYARPYLYNSLVSLAHKLHEEATNAHPTALNLSLQPDTSKWTVEGREQDADTLYQLLLENKATLTLVLRRRMYALKRHLVQESKQMRRALTSSSMLVLSAMDKRRQAQALHELLPHVKSRPFVFNQISVTAGQLESEAQLLEQITSRASNSKAVVPITLTDKQHIGRYVTNPPATLEERNKDIEFMDELLYVISDQVEDQDAAIHTHLLLCLQECHHDAKALEKHMMVLKDVHDLEQRAMQTLIE